MAGFYNPFSKKPDYASGLSGLASQVMQFLAINKMGGNGGGSFKKRMALPGAQTPQMPTMPQQMGMQGNVMAPGQGGAPAQRQIPKQGPMGDPTSPVNLQKITQGLAYDPALQAAFLAFVAQARVKDPFAVKAGGQQGNQQGR